MAFSVQLYKGESISAGAAFALDHGLYENEPIYWLQYRLAHIAGRPYEDRGVWGDHRICAPVQSDAHIAIGLLDLTPITLVLYDNAIGVSLSAYCKDEYRRQGYGGSTLKALREVEELSTKTLTAGRGIPGSLQFWTKQGIPEGTVLPH